MEMGLGGLRELVMDREAWCAVDEFMGWQRVGHNWATELNYQEQLCALVQDIQEKKDKFFKVLYEIQMKNFIWNLKIQI